MKGPDAEGLHLLGRTWRPPASLSGSPPANRGSLTVDVQASRLNHPDGGDPDQGVFSRGFNGTIRQFRTARLRSLPIFGQQPIL